jgi:hypothetical protein
MKTHKSLNQTEPENRMKTTLLKRLVKRPCRDESMWVVIHMEWK